MVQYILMIDEKNIETSTYHAICQGEGSLVAAPHALLRRFIANYTFTNPKAMPGEQMVLPSASNTLVYSVGEDGIVGGLRGVNTKPVVIGTFAREFRFLFLVEFHPGGLYPFLHMDQHLLLDRAFSFADIDGMLHRKILEAYFSAGSIEELVGMLDHIFLERLKDTVLHPAITGSMELALRSGGKVRARDLAGEVYYSEKHLNRLFHQQIGTGVKSFLRIVRMKHAVDLLGSPISLLQLAEATGHYDPSHFVRDFLEFYGITPQAYRSRMSLFYNDPYKLGGYHGEEFVEERG